MTRTTVANRSVIRSGTGSPKRYLSVGTRPALFTDQITDLVVDADSGGVVALDHANSWESSGVLPGMTVDIGTTAGARDVGSVRLRYFNSTNTRATIAETAAADVPIEIGHYLSVRLEFLPWQIPKRIVLTRDGEGNITAVTEYMDYDIPYSGGTNARLPKANITAGEHDDGSVLEVTRAGWVDDYGTADEKDYRTVTLTCKHSVIHNAGATKASQAWVFFGGATYVSGSATDETITVRLPVGFQYVGLIITDSTGATNGDMHQYMGLWTHNDANPPLTDFAVTADETDAGRDMQLEFFGDPDSVDATVLPKRALVHYWETPDYLSGEAPPAERSQCAGWVYEDEPVLKLADSRYGIRFGATAAWKQRFRANSVTLIDTATTPTTYTEIAALTVDRAMDFSLRAVDTLRQLVNVYYSGVTAQVERLTLPLGNAWTQLAETSPKAAMAKTRCDSLGNVWVRVPVSYLPAGGRAARLTAFDAEADDWTDEDGLTLPTENARKVGIVSAAAELWNGGDRVLYGSIAPSITPGAGLGTDRLPDQFLSLPNPQERLNALAGWHYAVVNNPRPDVLLTVFADVVEPAWAEPVSLTWTEDTVRGTLLNEALFALKRVSVQHSSDTDGTTPFKRVLWMLEQVTDGAAGKTVPQLQMPDVTPPADTACAITAGFTAVSDGFQVTFTNTTTGDLPYAWIWSFGDGEYSIAWEPVHTYAAPGTYDVELLVLSECFAADLFSDTVDAVGAPAFVFDTAGTLARTLDYFDNDADYADTKGDIAGVVNDVAIDPHGIGAWAVAVEAALLRIYYTDNRFASTVSWTLQKTTDVLGVTTGARLAADPDTPGIVWCAWWNNVQTLTVFTTDGETWGTISNVGSSTSSVPGNHLIGLCITGDTVYTSAALIDGRSAIYKSASATRSFTPLTALYSLFPIPTIFPDGSGSLFASLIPEDDGSQVTFRNDGEWDHTYVLSSGSGQPNYSEGIDSFGVTAATIEGDTDDTGTWEMDIIYEVEIDAAPSPHFVYNLTGGGGSFVRLGQFNNLPNPEIDFTIQLLDDSMNVLYEKTGSAEKDGSNIQLPLVITPAYRNNVYFVRFYCIVTSDPPASGTQNREIISPVLRFIGGTNKHYTLYRIGSLSVPFTTDYADISPALDVSTRYPYALSLRDGVLTAVCQTYLGANRIYESNDGGDNWTLVNGSPSPADVRGAARGDGVIAFWGDASLQSSDDGGATFVDREKNWAAAFGSLGTVLGVAPLSGV